MDVKKTLMKQAMKLAENPKVMEAAMRAISLRGQVASQVEGASRAVARSLNLATRDEVKELRRTIRRLEDELARRDAKPDGDG
ncbi:MAG: hypothetical protein R3A52_31625 [Polyangiales bacterium]